MSIIRTVLGDIAPADLGICLPHEHVYGQPPPQYAEPDLILDDEAGVIAELRGYYAANGRALVEMTTPDYGRNAAAMQRIARASHVHIIAATGYNKERFSAPFLESADVEILAARFAAEVQHGMDGTDAPAGVIKASSTLNAISPLAEKLFAAAALAHHRTGAPISTHTEAGTMALEQVDLLTRAGVPPDRIIIGHTDRNPDFALHTALAQRGVFLGYDQIGKAKYHPDSLRADLVARMVDAGFGGQILLAGDRARKSNWAAHGGQGFAHVLMSFVPLLRARGLEDAQIDALLIANPARALAFEPKG
ncbi:MAG: phosphotriesterase [Chloroflexi bacterium]|nr:phosphotriesterase [Chloroflexota bacterium]